MTDQSVPQAPQAPGVPVTLRDTIRKLYFPRRQTTGIEEMASPVTDSERRRLEDELSKRLVSSWPLTFQQA